MSGKKHASIKALEYYYYFHKCLIFLVTNFPHLRQYVEQTIEEFITNLIYRTKQFIPNIRKFLPLLSVSSKC
jgi:hypothetical protein